MNAAVAEMLTWLKQSVLQSRANSAVRRTMVLLAIAYAIALIVVGFDKVRHLDWLQYLQAAGAGLLIYPIALLAQAVAWSLLMGRMTGLGPSFSWSDVRVFATSQLMKRLPGGVWYIAGRASENRDRGIAMKVSVAASGSEIALLAATSGTIFVSLAYLPLRPPTTIAVALLASVAVSSLVGVLVALVRRRFGCSSKPAEAWELLTTTGAVALTFLALGVLYVTSVLVGAVILVQLANAGEASRLSFDQALKLWSLIAGIGAVVAVVPFGIGLRDLTVASVLSVALSPAEAIVTAAFFRLILMVGDVVWGIPIWLVSRWLADNRPRRRALIVASVPPSSQGND